MLHSVSLPAFADRGQFVDKVLEIAGQCRVPVVVANAFPDCGKHL